MSLIEKPLVSVIMGIYNCEDTIERAIKSILAQTYNNWELIMCDDASSDNTYKIANKYAQRYNNIILLKNSSNKRLAYSLNKCLKCANGKYIARMDSDDESLPERFERQVDFLEKHLEYHVVGSAMVLFDEHGENGIRRCKECPMQDDIWNSSPFAHPTIMMRKYVYDTLNGYTVSKDTMRAEDLDLWFRFKISGYMGYNIQTPLYRYHESLEDYKKRNIRAAIGTAKLIYKYYKLMHIKNKYIWIIKPIISALLPNKLMFLYHKSLDRF